MIKRVLSVLILMFSIFTLQLAGETKVEAGAVQIYDGGVGHIIDCIRQGANIKNVSVGEPYYATKEGIKCCILAYGSYNNNKIVFQLNNNGAVSRILITCYKDETGVYQAATMMLSILTAIGLNSSEQENFANNMNKEYTSIWCSASSRYITYKRTNGSTYVALFFEAYI